MINFTLVVYLVMHLYITACPFAFPHTYWDLHINAYIPSHFSIFKLYIQPETGLMHAILSLHFCQVMSALCK